MFYRASCLLFVDSVVVSFHIRCGFKIYWPLANFFWPNIIVIFYQQFQNYFKLLYFKIRNNFYFLAALVSCCYYFGNILVIFWYLKKYFLDEPVLCITSFTVYLLFAYARNLELC